tara:strand:- start:1661 stop:2338 length:678 start_codon:yes stop_codon:yes gene_type:complete
MYAIACSKKWFLKHKNDKKYIFKNFLIIDKKKDFNYSNLKKNKIKKIFLPHWNFILSNKIINNFECIGFHLSPLPYGRGGSPIQNLILRNFKKAPLCSFRITNKIDAGPIFFKNNISLKGNLEAIFNRMVPIIDIHIRKIIKNKNAMPKLQKGLPKYFKRLKYTKNEIKSQISINKIYDMIRMVDSDDYKKSYIRKKNIIFEFSGAIKKNNYITATVKIKKLNDK